ncbi:MAG: diguanylate cyclase [Magnetococcales bacterium]|nr:diguanylate cyclase [Magnetococcales bacterium]
MTERPSSSNRPGVLLRQAAARVLTVTLAVVAAIALLASWFQHAALDKSVLQAMDSLATFYSEKMILLEQEWQERAANMHHRLEMQNLFAQPGTEWARLSSALDQEDLTLFPIVLVTNAEHRILFKRLSDNVSFPDSFNPSPKLGWFHDPQEGRLYRWVAHPFWLGERGAGWLIAFVPVDNAVLFRNALPFTDLFLIKGEKLVASSLGGNGFKEEALIPGSRWRGAVRTDVLSLPWGEFQNAPPRLVIRHHSQPLFSSREILLAGLVAFFTLSILFWWTLGRWITRLTLRITTLGRLSREFAEGYHLTPDIERELLEAHHPGGDEVAAVAEAMKQLTSAVVKRTGDLEKQAIRLSESEERFRALTNSLSDALVVYDDHGVIQLCNQITGPLFGYDEIQLLGSSIETLFSPRWVSALWREKLLIHNPEGKLEQDATLEGIALRSDGREFPVEISLSGWRRKNKTFHTAVLRDISSHRLLEARDMRAYVNRVAISALLEIGLEPLPLRRKLEVALEIILTVPWLAVQYKGSIFLADQEGSLDMVVQKGLHAHLLIACRHIPPGYCLCGRAAQSRTIVFSNCLDHRHDVTFEGIGEHGHYCVPILLKSALLGVLNLYVDHGHLHDPEEDAFLTTIANTLAGVIERGVVEDRVQHMATHDALTGLPNRTLFKELLEQEMRHAFRLDQVLAVGFLDLDHFKEVNDTLGHEAGDLLLKIVAEKVKQCLRDSDILARLGGDEFTLILPAIGRGEHAAALANKIIHALSQPIPIHDHPCQIGVSIGLALYPDHGENVEALLIAADQAMYQVKRTGRNRCLIHSKEMAPT